MKLNLLKKTYLAALMMLACGANEDANIKPVVEEFKQYGTPFASVPDARNVVLYEVNIRAFSEAGTFDGITARLDALKDLGVNTLWLMPIHPVGVERSAGGLGSPYSVRNYMEVSSEYGTLEDFRDLVSEAHKRNMAVIIDWVANHTSWDNPWMANKSWYTQDASGNVVIPAGTNWQDVADLNYNNMDMRKAMIRAMKYWVLEANVDGFRCDAVDFVPTDFWKQAISELTSIQNRKLILLAEGGKAENFTAGFQMNYAWDFLTNLQQVYKTGKAATTIFTAHEAEYANIPAGAVKLRYTTNHDLSAWEETPIEAFGSDKAALSASVVTIFTSAAPLIYNGQEVGRAEKLPFFTKDPINWEENPDMLQGYDRILSLYNGTDAFKSGTLKYYSHNDIAAFKRESASDKFLVLVNVRNNSKTWTVPEEIKNLQWRNTADGSDFALGESVSLDAFGFLILKQK